MVPRILPPSDSPVDPAAVCRVHVDCGTAVYGTGGIGNMIKVVIVGGNAANSTAAIHIPE